MSRFALASLIVGLIAAAFVVPWALTTINQSTALLKSQQEALAPVSALAPVAPAMPEPAVNAEVVRTEPEPVKTEQAPEVVAQPVAESQPYSIVPSGSTELTPIEGWVDQPDKSRAGRLHTNLMFRWSTQTEKPKRGAARAPCLKKVARSAERILRPYGWVDVPARTVLVPCSDSDGQS